MDTFKYCKVFWELNDHRLTQEWERDYYKGKSGKNPHGIEDEEWRLAYEQYILEKGG